MAWHDFIPPEVLPAENFATGTIFERYNATLRSDGTIARPLRVPMPAKGSFKTDTAADRFARARAGMLEAGWLEEATAPPEPARAILLGMERLHPPLEELRAVRSRAGCRFSQSEQVPPKTEFHAAGVAADAARVWSLRMDAHLAVGEPAEAREDFLDAMRLYTALLDEPTLINGLVRQSILTVVLQAVNGGIAARQWRDEDLPEIATVLAPVDIVADARHAFSSERGFINTAFDSLRGESILKQARYEEVADLLSEKPHGWRLLLDLAKGSSWREQLLENQYLDRHLENLSAGFPQMYAPEAALDDLEKIPSLGIFNEVAKRNVIVEMSRRETLAAVALERCRQKRGDFPETLAELVPEFLAAIPNDVMDNQLVKYRHTEAGKFLLYSVGANVRDDGGVAASDRKLPGTYKAQDWVWGENWR